MNEIEVKEFQMKQNNFNKYFAINNTVVATGICVCIRSMYRQCRESILSISRRSFAIRSSLHSALVHTRKMAMQSALIESNLL